MLALFVFIFILLLKRSALCCSIVGPLSLEHFVGEDAEFRWNNTCGKEILSATWGIRKGNIADPQFINVEKSNKLHFNLDMNQNYVGRVDFVGNLTVGQAWFILKNLTLDDNNDYIGRIVYSIYKLMTFNVPLKVVERVSRLQIYRTPYTLLHYIMALNFVNTLNQCPFKVEVLFGRPPTCDRSQLQSLLDHDEARRMRLDTRTYKDCVNDICDNKNGNDRLTLISFSKIDNQPVALIAFRKNQYQPTVIQSLPGQNIRGDILQTLRKSLWELQYIVRRPEFRSQCLGDILLSCGLESLSELVFKGFRATTIVWLIVSNSFLNTSALRLYLSYGFQVIGMYQSGLMMALSDLDGRKVDKAGTLMIRHVESLFLLPDLKKNIFQVEHGRPSTSGNQRLISHEQEDESTESSDESEASFTAPVAKRRRTSKDEQVPHAASQTTQNSDDVRYQDVESLQFSDFEEHLKWTPTIVTSVDGDVNEMSRKVKVMKENSEKIDERQSFLQHLEMAKQIEIVSKKVNKNSYDVIYDLQNAFGLSIQYLRSILRVSWAVFRYPVLEQCRIQWKVSARLIPKIAFTLDHIVEENERFPANITAAQRDRHSLYVRISLQYPEQHLGDGDGLPSTTVLTVNGLYRDDAPVENGESIENTSWYRRICDTLGTEMRCRLVGFDTQEAPRPCDERDVDTPQPFWEEGRTFLTNELQNLLGDVPPEDGIILADCFSIDLFNRLLIDIRGIYRRDQMAGTDHPQPSLRRFEVAHRALLSGYAFPTYNFFASDTLLSAFEQAREQLRGAFESEGPVYHPSVCRKHRYQMTKDQTRARRRRYDE